MRLLTRTLAALTVAPVAIWAGCVALVLVLSGPFGCTIHEGFANPCTVLGLDLSDLAYSAGVLGAWGPLLFGPFVLLTGLGWAVCAMIRRRRERT